MNEWNVSYTIDGCNQEARKALSYLEATAFIAGELNSFFSGQKAAIIKLSACEEQDKRAWHIYKEQAGYLFSVTHEDDEQSGFFCSGYTFYKKGNDMSPCFWHGGSYGDCLPRYCFVKAADITHLIKTMTTQKGIVFCPDHWVSYHNCYTTNAIKHPKTIQPQMQDAQSLAASKDWELSNYSDKEGDSQRHNLTREQALTRFFDCYLKAIEIDDFTWCTIQNEGGQNYAFETTQDGVIISVINNENFPNEDFYYKAGTGNGYRTVPSTEETVLATRCFLPPEKAKHVLAQLFTTQSTLLCT